MMSVSGAELAKCDMTVAEADLLAHHSLGLHTINEFAINIEPKMPKVATIGIKREIFRGYALGISQGLNDKSPYSLACYAFGLRHCFDFSSYLHCDSHLGVPEYIDREMKSLTEDGAPLIFFVPPKLRSHSLARLTREEMSWSLSNLDSIGNIRFVFGLYDFVERHLIDQSDLDVFGCARLLLATLNEHLPNTV